MKVELIVAVVLTGLSVGERQQRSTVLTDESKRILDHFDFSNFDKQEALNYLDRQRYENQIRGKRSQSKFRRDHEKSNGNAQDTTFEKKLLPDPNIKSQLKEKKDLRKRIENKVQNILWSYKQVPRPDEQAYVRHKRRRRFRKKHKNKMKTCVGPEDEVAYNEDKEESKKYRKRKKKKKRHYWDRWTEWSPCSVTCGRGRKIRWRKCVAKNCTTGELEMGEKTCQLPACNLFTKILGLK